MTASSSVCLEFVVWTFIYYHYRKGKSRMHFKICKTVERNLNLNTFKFA